METCEHQVLSTCSPAIQSTSKQEVIQRTHCLSATRISRVTMGHTVDVAQ